MNEGTVATRLGLPGIPNISESVMVQRDIALCGLTGGRLHIAHVSTKESVDAIRLAKRQGLPVTAETAPHYFTLTHDAVKDYDTHAKMNPPLRSERDCEAIREGVADGTLDAIATDHAPHSPLEKNVEFNLAANGIVGLETSLPLSLNLVAEGVIDMETLILRMSKRPAEILGVPCGISEGGVADLTVIDPGYEYVMKSSDLLSKSKNTPFDGWNLKGRAVWTIVGGHIVFEEQTR
jgi:dihydroorotase